MPHSNGASATFFAEQVGDRLAVAWNEGIEVDKLRDSLVGTIRDPGGDHSAVAMSDQDHLAKVFEIEHRQDVRDVNLQIRVRARKMPSFADYVWVGTKKS